MLTIVGVFLLALIGCSSAAAAVSVYPAPGVRTAMPGTQISFRGAPAAQLGPIAVTGSRSGRHRGKVEAHSDGNGGSFVPDKAFTPGERVTVRTQLDIVGVRNGDYGITIGRPTTVGPRVGEAPNVGRGAIQQYASEPHLTPPAVVIRTATAGGVRCGSLAYCWIAPRPPW